MQELSKLLEFDEQAHEYYLGGVRLPSVTQLLDEFGLIDYSMVSPYTLEYKRLVGVATHKATELYDLHTLNFDRLDDHIRGFVHAWVQFRVDTGFLPQLVELRMASKRGFAEIGRAHV